MSYLTIVLAVGGWYLLLHIASKRLIEIENEELRDMQEHHDRMKD